MPCLAPRRWFANSLIFRHCAKQSLRRNRAVIAALATVLLGSWLVACAAREPEPNAAPPEPPQAVPTDQQPGAVTLEDVQRELEWRKETKKKLDQTLQ